MAITVYARLCKCGCKYDAPISSQGDSQSSTSIESSLEGEVTGGQPRRMGISLVPMESMENLESGMSSSNSEESLQAFSRGGEMNRESFVLKRVR